MSFGFPCAARDWIGPAIDIPTVEAWRAFRQTPKARNYWYEWPNPTFADLLALVARTDIFTWPDGAPDIAPSTILPTPVRWGYVWRWWTPFNHAPRSFYEHRIEPALRGSAMLPGCITFTAVDTALESVGAHGYAP